MVFYFSSAASRFRIAGGDDEKNKINRKGDNRGLLVCSKQTQTDEITCSLKLYFFFHFSSFLRDIFFMKNDVLQFR